LEKKPEENDAKVNIDGQAIESVKSFIYLGSEFTWDNDCSKDMQRLLQQQPGASTPYKRWSKCTMEKVGGSVFAET